MNQSQKKELRREILSKRSRIEPELLQKLSEAVCQKVLASRFFQEARTLMIYLDFRNEVMTRGIIEAAWRQSKRTAVPVCRREPFGLIASELFSFEDLTPGTWGILEPKADCLRPVPPAELDLVLVPGVAFDLQGNRLGYGAGYYDRFLTTIRPDCVTAALAFEEQVLPRIEAESHDVPVQWVITPERVVRCLVRGEGENKE